jgi:hypothetical protein
MKHRTMKMSREPSRSLIATSYELDSREVFVRVPVHARLFFSRCPYAMKDYGDVDV